MMDDLVYLPVSEMARLISQKQVSPVELAMAHLERIKAVQPKVNAFITILEQEALEAARQAEREIRTGSSRGTLHGLPVGIKDSLRTRGIRTTNGFKLYEDFVPEDNAALTDRLLGAGAYIIGKLNATSLAYDATGGNPFFGDVQNPWKRGHMSGGSSSGSAVAAVTGQCPITVGTDTGGSIRIPAALSGAVGLKPTFGLLSRHGMLAAAPSFDHAGPLVRTVEDCAIVLNALAGYDPRDPGSARVPLPDYARALQGSIDGIRIGIPRELFWNPIDPDVYAAARQAVDQLASAGASVSEVSAPLLEETVEIMMPIQQPEAITLFEDVYPRYGHLMPPLLRSCFEQGAATPATAYVRAQERRVALRQQCARLFEQVDVLLTPSVPITAPAYGTESVTMGGRAWDITDILTLCTRPWNVTGHPALSVPCGFSRGGLPIGLQIVGRHFDDATVLRVGHAYQSMTDWHKRHPAP
jgi:aspartyl-tRNA(Asn)/glutamyl-tRNA(Gln) amidotransferase subunit A